MKYVKRTVALGLLAAGASAFALPSYVKGFEDHYGVESGTSLNKASCSVCHTGMNLNPYGQDLKAFLDANNTKTLTPEVLKSVEKLDSDKDGAANLDEIRAGALPGDATSLPPQDPAGTGGGPAGKPSRKTTVSPSGKAAARPSARPSARPAGKAAAKTSAKPARKASGKTSVKATARPSARLSSGIPGKRPVKPSLKPSLKPAGGAAPGAR